MLTLWGGQVESLWDEVLGSGGARAARGSRPAGPGALRPGAAWAGAAGVGALSARSRSAVDRDEHVCVRLMVIKARTGWGYQTLVREVSDSLHLRRFCLISIDQRVPDESTVRKLARRLGSAVVEEITRVVIEKAKRETRFRARAARIDSTVIEADIRYPSDAMLALQGARTLAREARKVARIITDKAVHVRDRSRSLGRTVRQLSRTLARRTGEAKAQVMTLNQRAGG